ncbi:BlaI/MecI/CopY family transcriptional regulator [Intestinimonas massiliensis (ex Afouda et al. 2020)]|uniref:BlaI/MecI/CopY family transcriptional regulator n=1 Tax=Intestinimonas massiliensis (ex Afouda et al. 2020) TaxID=1673721 RepID=UPI00102F5615|nr:BlaI/MecI/CopY family transcriptional regulator [Intestinimonas massiliensis (ex Afouda et al. 2020)]
MKLSDKEWQVLEALWEAESGLSLGQAVEALRPATGWSRNTVLTYLTRMEAKGLVVIDKTAAPHCYRAGVDREACAAQERQGLLDRVYQGSAGRLVAAFLKEEKLTAQEREELRKLLDDMEV